MAPNIVGLGLIVAGIIFMVIGGVVLWILGVICLIGGVGLGIRGDICLMGGVGAVLLTWPRRTRTTV